jgi:hypothetical protein
MFFLLLDKKKNIYENVFVEILLILYITSLLESKPTKRTNLVQMKGIT